MSEEQEKTILLTDEDKTEILETTLLYTAGKGFIKAEEIPEEWHEGSVIGGIYKVIRIIGEGAFGKVYKVRHLLWDSDLAVKSLRPGLAEIHRDSFIRECQGWINLGIHPNIVTCYYIRDLGGLPRIFLEYIEGGNLYNRIQEHISWKEIIDFSIQCLDGLSFAHSKGIIHRDIKPLNCLLTAEGIGREKQMTWHSSKK